MRYPWAQRITGDDFVQTFESAKNAGLQVIISNGAYTLYRDAGTNPVFAPNTTSANFQLTHALASLYSPATFSNHPIEVSSGVLAVNFVNNTFNTSLNLSSPMIGETSVVAQGIVASNGNLASRSGNAEVFGGFNYNVVPEELPKYLTEEIKPHHILIVDVPNMMTKWYMEKKTILYRKKFL